MCLVKFLVPGDFEHCLREFRSHQASTREEDQCQPDKIRDTENEDELSGKNWIQHLMVVDSPPTIRLLNGPIRREHTFGRLALEDDGISRAWSRERGRSLHTRQEAGG